MNDLLSGRKRKNVCSTFFYIKTKKIFFSNVKFIGKKEGAQKLVGINGKNFLKTYKYRFEKTINNVRIYKDDFISKMKMTN